MTTSASKANYGTRSKVQFELHDCGQKDLRSKNEHEW